MRRAILAAALGAALMPASASAQTIHVTMPGLSFNPAIVGAVVGDTVQWQNADFETHTVTSTDAGFDSGFVAAGSQYQHRFTQAGRFSYICTIHRGMHGVVFVYAIRLLAPDNGPAPGGSALVRGNAPAGTTSVAIQQLGANGAATTVTTVAVAADGHFSATVHPSRPTSYRAVAAGASSPAVLVPVAPIVTLSAHRGRGDRYVIYARSGPNQGGATVELQRYVPELFRYVKVRFGRLGPTGLVRFVYRTQVRTALRVAVVAPRGGYSIGISGPVMVGRRPPFG